MVLMIPETHVRLTPCSSAALGINTHAQAGSVTGSCHPRDGGNVSCPWGHLVVGSADSGSEEEDFFPLQGVQLERFMP